jgi:hypothetical protein
LERGDVNPEIIARPMGTGQIASAYDFVV